MAKWFGKVGYSTTSESVPGVWENTDTERSYYGDVIRHSTKWSPNSAGTNDNLNISNQISIVADPFAYQHFQHIKYCEFMGVLWEVSSVEPQYPRLILTLGGVYNG